MSVLTLLFEDDCKLNLTTISKLTGEQLLSYETQSTSLEVYFKEYRTLHPYPSPPPTMLSYSELNVTKRVILLIAEHL